MDDESARVVLELLRLPPGSKSPKQLRAHRQAFRARFEAAHSRSPPAWSRRRWQNIDRIISRLAANTSERCFEAIQEKPTSQRAPAWFPWAGEPIPGQCQAINWSNGLLNQCNIAPTADSPYCEAHKTTRKWGTVRERMRVGPMEYKCRGHTCKRLANVVGKLDGASLDDARKIAKELKVTIPPENFERRGPGRPPSRNR